MASENADASVSLHTLADRLLRLEALTRSGAADSEQAAALAELQKASTWALRAAVARARQQGVSWRELADLLDMPAMTLHRQFRTGRGLVATGQNQTAPPSATELPAADAAARVALAVKAASSAQAVPPSPDSTVGKPPPVHDRFVGRERELADLRPLLASGRLVTLTGPGGVGKTRLALEFLGKFRASYRGGVRWVDLAPLSDGALVAPAVVAAVYGERPPTGSIEEVVADGYGSRAALIVLDNCEHVVEACAKLVEQLLKRCARLRVLATSREALRITGEHVLPLQPLPIPDGPATGAGHAQSAAAQLFVDRARAADPSFTLTAGMAATIGEICARLDGLPLAIELAARQAAVLPPARLLQEADRHLDLLVGGLRTAPRRHQSLRAAIQWSYDLLDAEQQQVFRRLALLPGGFDETLAQALCTDLDLPRHRLWPLLTGLAAQSLLVPDTSSQPGRFRILESLRVFGTEQLDATGERKRVHEQLLTWAADLSEKFLLWTSESEVATHVDTERHNLHYALTLAERCGDPRLLGLGAALALSWITRGNVCQAQELTERLLTAHPDASVGRAHLCSMLSLALSVQGRYAEAVLPAEEALHLAEALQHPVLTARALGAISRSQSGLGEHEAAIDTDRRWVEILRTLGRPLPIANALNNLAWTLLMADRPDEAAGHIEESLSLIDSHSAPEALSAALHTAATVALARRQYGQAALYCTIALSAPLVDTTNTLHNIESLAIIAIADGRPERGLRLLATAAQTRKKMCLSADPRWTAMLETAAQDARQALPTHRATAAQTDGAALTPDEAVHYALNNAWPRARSSGHASILTRREQQVAELVAQGLTNQQIAARLHVSRRTVTSHLENIRTRLGLSSRAALAAWVTSEQTYTEARANRQPPAGG